MQICIVLLAAIVAFIEPTIIHTPAFKDIVDNVALVVDKTFEAIVPLITCPKLLVPVPVVALYGVVAVGRVIVPVVVKGPQLRAPVDGTNDNAEAVFKGNPPVPLELLTNGI